MHAADRGLSARQVEEARQRHGPAASRPSGGRTYGQIARANLFTFFNNILFGIGLALLALGRVSDAVVSAGLGLLNAVISAVQEMRAKHALDVLRRRHGARVRAVRDGAEREVAAEDLVVGDLVHLRRGDEVLADGLVEGPGHLQVDESGVTGASGPAVERAVVKQSGDRLLAGSLVLAGDAHLRVLAPAPGGGPGAAGAGAPGWTSSRTPLQRQVDLVVRAVILTVALMSAAILGQASMEGLPLVRVVQISAVLSGLVPYGLFLLVTLAYSVGAATIARRGALVQQVNAVEALSNVDVLLVSGASLTAGPGGPLRPDARETLADLRRRGVEVKLLTADDPAAAELASRAGLGEESVVAGADRWQKERAVESLVRSGRYVAVVGSGPDDVASLQRAHVGIALQSSSAGARDVADIVLLEDSFAALPTAHREGQRIIGGISTAMNLFLTRVGTSMVVILGVAILGIGFPYEPAQLSLTLFTVGLPTLFLTAWARPRRPDPHLIANLVRFVVPAAVVTGAFAVAIYAAMYTLLRDGLTRGLLPEEAVVKFEDFTSLARTDAAFVETTATAVAQTGLSMFTSVTAFLLVLFLEPPTRFFAGWAPVRADRRPALLVLALFATFVTVLYVPELAAYFALVQPGGFEAPIVAVTAVVWFFALRTVWRRQLLQRALGLPPGLPGASDA